MLGNRAATATGACYTARAMISRYYAAACQTDFACPTERGEIAERTGRMCALIEQTLLGYEPFFDVRLFVFPEFAHAAPIYDSVAKPPMD